MKRILSLVAISCIINSSLIADNLSESFKNGTFSGDFTLYGESIDNNTGSDNGFAGSIGLNYTTDSYYGLKLSLGTRSNSNFSELIDEDGDYGTGGPKTILHTANVSYKNDFAELKVGRQRMELEWVKDFHEAYLIHIKPMKSLDLTFAHSNKRAKSNPDEALIDFGKLKAEDGAYIFDAKYKALDNLDLNAYFYSANDVANWYGAKVDFNVDSFGLGVHYANSDVDTSIASEDGSILHLEARTKINTINIKAGYIRTDKDTGISGIMDIMGDNINFFDDGNQIYVANADTYYLGGSYSLDKFVFGALYGQTEYGTLDEKEKELNLTIDYKLTKEMNLSAAFIDVDTASDSDDYNRIELKATYSF